MSATRADRALLRMVCGSSWWLMADAIGSDDGIRFAIQGRPGGNFGSGSMWGRYVVEPHGIDIYQQSTGVTATVTWTAVRDIRRSATSAALDRLAAASRLAKSGPRYTIPHWPVPLRPESLDPTLTPEQIAEQRAAVDERWEREVHAPFLAARKTASDALAAAFDEVLADSEPMDLLEIMAAAGAA